ncbi:MAG: hypothetical protein QM706_15405 [Nitrospira sp.]
MARFRYRRRTYVDRDILTERDRRRFTERQATREEGVRLIRMGHLLQADSPERIQARLRRLGIDRRVANLVAGTKAGLGNGGQRRIIDSVERPNASDSMEQEKVYAVMGEALGIESSAISPAERDINELLLERIVGRNDLLGVAYMDRGLTASRTVGCVRLFENGRFLGIRYRIHGVAAVAPHESSRP